MGGIVSIFINLMGGVTREVVIGLVGPQIGFNDGQSVNKTIIRRTRMRFKFSSPVVIGKDGLNLGLSGVEKNILMVKISDKNVDDVDILLEGEGRELRDEGVSG